MFIYSCSSRRISLKSIVFTVCKHEYMNIHPIIVSSYGPAPSFLPIIVDQISDYANERGMRLNPKKCKDMVITYLKYKLIENDIFIGGDVVERVSSFKLGV